MKIKEDIGYTWARWNSSCTLCKKAFRRGDGIGRPVNITSQFGGSESKSTWAHARCADTWQREMQSKRSESAVQGYASRMKKNTYKLVERRPSRCADKYSKPQPARGIKKVQRDLSYSVLGDIISADRILGHGILSGLLPKMCSDLGYDYRTIAGKTLDTRVLAFLDYPIQSGKKQTVDQHSLLNLAPKLSTRADFHLPDGTAMVLTGITSERAEAHKLSGLAHELNFDAYAIREHRILAIASDAANIGFRVDAERLENVSPNAMKKTFEQSIQRNVVAGRVHPRIHAETSTGRLQTSNPNLFGAGKRVDLLDQRDLFLPEEGEVILVADLSQIDARIVAALSQDPDYLALFAPGVDMYTEMASEFLGSPTRRVDMKKVVNAINYGAGGRSLTNLGLEVGTAKQIMRYMAQTFPLWVKWRQEITERARAGELLHSGYGRKISVTPGKASTAGPGSIAQSTARDVFMDGVLRMESAGLAPYLRLLMHDEVVMSVPRDRYHEIAIKTKDCLSGQWGPFDGALQVPIEATVGRAGATWADAYRTLE